MENEKGHAWNVSKDRLIREIKSTYEAIMKFQDFKPKSSDDLSALNTEQLYEELQNQTSVLDKLIIDWDIRR